MPALGPPVARIVPPATVRIPPPETPPPGWSFRALTVVGRSIPAWAVVRATLLAAPDPDAIEVAYSAAVSGRTPVAGSRVTSPVPVPVVEVSAMTPGTIPTVGVPAGPPVCDPMAEENRTVA